MHKRIFFAGLLQSANEAGPLFSPRLRYFLYEPFSPNNYRNHTVWLPRSFKINGFPAKYKARRWNLGWYFMQRIRLDRKMQPKNTTDRNLTNNLNKFSGRKPRNRIKAPRRLTPCIHLTTVTLSYGNLEPVLFPNWRNKYSAKNCDCIIKNILKRIFWWSNTAWA